MAKSIYG